MRIERVIEFFMALFSLLWAVEAGAVDLLALEAHKAHLNLARFQARSPAAASDPQPELGLESNEARAVLSPSHSVATSVASSVGFNRPVGLFGRAEISLWGENSKPVAHPAYFGEGLAPTFADNPYYAPTVVRLVTF